MRVEATSHDSLKVWYNESMDSQYEFIYAYVIDDSANNCNLMKNKTSCEIRGLSPCKLYNIGIIGCTIIDNADSCSQPVEVGARTKPSGEFTTPGSQFRHFFYTVVRKVLSSCQKVA